MADVGRPTIYADDLADRIFTRIAGGESLRLICKEDDMPDRATVFRWLAANKQFRDQYTHAREAQADSLFDDILEIADASKGDRKIVDGVEVVDHEHIQRSKLRVDARKWMAGKLRPKKYGDKQEIEHSGAVAVNVVDYSKASDD